MDNNGLIRDEVSEKIIYITARLTAQIGAHSVTVKKILAELGTTNRVFYNRFHNVDEVLRIVYANAVVNMRQCFKSEYDSKEEFFDYCMDVAVNVFVSTYDIKMQFSRYTFEHDSLTESNRTWWSDEMIKVCEYSRSNGLIKKDADIETLSYSIWCFCRGYNTDAVSRGLSKEDALKYFKFAFGYFLEGIKELSH